MRKIEQDQLVGRLAQALGERPFDVVIRFTTPKHRRALLRQEAVRQDELSRLVREKLLRAGELWAPAPGSRLAREWSEVKRRLVAEGVIHAE